MKLVILKIGSVKMAIALVGFMGSGKTTVGQILAKFLNIPWIDLDQKIEEEVGMPIHKFLTKFNENVFRAKESQLLLKNLKKEIVLSTGGGVVIKECNRKALKKESQCCICLTASFPVLIKRIRQNKENIRPLAAKSVKKLFAERKSWYKEVATLTIQTDEKSPTSVAKEIIQRMKKL
ncbi:MAG: shikimate kinase [Lactobacillales bacterium]|jgi:shikimate kinase|nr:shikimate kinase [Lactobacillales bacterium]